MKRLLQYGFCILLFISFHNTVWALECQHYFKAQDLKNNIKNSQNPLIGTSSLESGYYPEFDKIEPGHFVEAMESAVQLASNRLNKLEELSTPNFDNFILAMESLDQELRNLEGILSFYTGSFKTPEYSEVEDIFDSVTVEFYINMGTNEKIFEKIKSIYESSSIKNRLSSEQKILLDSLYFGFVRSGALLKGAQKERFKFISAELSTLQTRFSNNLTQYKKQTFVHVTNESELQGIPADIIGSMSASAKKRELPGYVIELAQPGVIMQVLERADSDSLRKELFLKNGKAGYTEDINNEPILRKIVELRQERAQLLGYKTHADYVLENQMAKTVNQVQLFLDQLFDAYKKKTNEEKVAIESYKKEHMGSPEISPWNRTYWITKYETSKLSLDTQVFKQYLEFHSVRDGFFRLAQSLYGIQFQPRPDLPRISPDIEVYQVLSQTGETYGYLTMDMHSRPIKSGGAWMSLNRPAYFENSKRAPALVSINLNTTKPENGQPFLLTLAEGETFYHEMGHALHGLLSQTTYASQSGTAVKRDFVELPSQIMENFFFDIDHMQSFAVHHQTGAPIPTEYLKKLEQQKQLLSGIATMRQISFAKLDMAWHTGYASTLPGTLSEVDNAILSPYQTFMGSNETSMSTGFTHIFSGGYSSGYYSYKWAEVLDADAYSIIKKEGVSAAQRFLKNVLQVGGSIDPNTAYENFAGRPASIEALLERDGVKK